MLSNKRLALLHLAKKKLVLTDDDYRAVLRAYGGAESARDLDDRGFDAVMDRFRALGFESDARQRSYGARIGMASPGQIELIRKLWGELASDPTEAHLNAWLERFGVSALRFMDTATARKVVAALKSWQARIERQAGEAAHR